MVQNLNFVLKAVVTHTEIFSRIISQSDCLNLLRNKEKWRKTVEERNDDKSSSSGGVNGSST